jgi:hypothetical protein
MPRRLVDRRPPDDPRITAAGYILRRYKFDELPRLVNALKGDMSLVSPWAEVPGGGDAVHRSLLCLFSHPQKNSYVGSNTIYEAGSSTDDPCRQELHLGSCFSVAEILAVLYDKVV